MLCKKKLKIRYFSYIQKYQKSVHANFSIAISILYDTYPFQFFGIYSNFEERNGSIDVIFSPKTYISTQ